MIQGQPGTLEIWQREFRGLRMPYFYNLRTGPYEFATIHVQYVLGRGYRSRVDSLPNGGRDRPVPEVHRGVSTRPETVIVHDRRRLQVASGGAATVNNYWGCS